MIKRLLRFAAVALVAMGAASALKGMEGGGRTVRLAYAGAPEGRLEVTLRDPEGHLLRRTTFEGSTFRGHEVSVAEGKLVVELHAGDADRRLEAFIGPDTESLELAWPR